MSEYKNGLNSMGNVSVGKDDISHDPVTGRAVFIDDARYDADSAYKAKVDDLIKQGFHKVSEGSGDGSSDFSTAQITCNKKSAITGCFTATLPMDEGSVEASYCLGLFGDQVILYKGRAVLTTKSTVVDTSGAIEQLDGSTYLVTGDCTITFDSDGGGGASA